MPPGLLANRPGIIAEMKRRHGELPVDGFVDALVEVRRTYLESTLIEIEAREGSVSAYLCNSGVQSEAQHELRESLLI